MAEKMSRLRLNRVSAGSHGIALVMSMEMLSMGIEGTRDLWQALEKIAAREPAVAKLDVPKLVSRAEAQHDVLENFRRALAPAALGCA